MKNLIITIALAALTMTGFAQMKKATKIIVHSNEVIKEAALNDFIDHLTENDIFFVDVNDKRGVARSEQFPTSGFGNWTTQSQIIIAAKETDNGIEIVITGSTTNVTTSGDVTIEMVNKHFMGHVGGVMFDHVHDIVVSYENKELLTYSK